MGSRAAWPRTVSSLPSCTEAVESVTEGLGPYIRGWRDELDGRPATLREDGLAVSVLNGRRAFLAGCADVSAARGTVGDRRI